VFSGEKLTPSSERSMAKPVSFVELSCHLRLICDAETAVALILLGAAGGPEAPATEAVLEYPELPAALKAATR
jgi:hypothetical protein